MKACIFDPGMETHGGDLAHNLGDLIIQRAVNREIEALGLAAQIIRYSSKQPLNWQQRKVLADCDFSFVGGSNLLSSNMSDFQWDNPAGTPPLYRQWKISFLDAPFLKNAILLGVGWWQYQRPPGFFTKNLLRTILSKNMLHSVRDGYTLKVLQNAGIKNVVNTCCPTMWPFAEMDQSTIASNKADTVLVMITDYLKEPNADRELLNLLKRKYKKVVLWPQGAKDAVYFSELNVDIDLLDHSFKNLEDFVNSGTSFDYIGTRLHGGIWCLHRRIRSLILRIDNRAAEISKDTGLPTVGRTDLVGISHWIDNPLPTQIKLPLQAIADWRNQFLSYCKNEKNNPLQKDGLEPLSPAKFSRT